MNNYMYAIFLINVYLCIQVHSLCVIYSIKFYAIFFPNKEYYTISRGSLVMY